MLPGRSSTGAGMTAWPSARLSGVFTAVDGPAITDDELARSDAILADKDA